MGIKINEEDKRALLSSASYVYNTLASFAKSTVNSGKCNSGKLQVRVTAGTKDVLFIVTGKIINEPETATCFGSLENAIDYYNEL